MTPFDVLGVDTLRRAVPPSRRKGNGSGGADMLRFMRIRWECKRCWEVRGRVQYHGTVIRRAAFLGDPEIDALDANSPRLVEEVAPGGHRRIIATCPTCADNDGPGPAQVIRRLDASASDRKSLANIFAEMTSALEVHRVERF